MMPIHYRKTFAFLAGTFLLAGCFKDEPLNAECDILEAAVTVADPAEVFSTCTVEKCPVSLPSDSQFDAQPSTPPFLR